METIKGRRKKKERGGERPFCFPLDSRTKRRIYFSSPKIIFITPFCILIFKKAFKKHKKKKKKNIERLKFLGRKPSPEGGTNPTLYMDTSALLRQPSPVERRMVGGPSIRERRCCRCSSQRSHHQTRPRELGMFSTFPLFILA